MEKNSAVANRILDALRNRVGLIWGNFVLLLIPALIISVLFGLVGALTSSTPAWLGFAVFASVATLFTAAFNFLVSYRKISKAGFIKLRKGDKVKFIKGRGAETVAYSAVVIEPTLETESSGCVKIEAQSYIFIGEKYTGRLGKSVTTWYAYSGELYYG